MSSTNRIELNLAQSDLRAVNSALQKPNGTGEANAFVVQNPAGAHALAGLVAQALARHRTKCCRLMN